ncbi:MAG TPA: hypothetical protein VGI89_09660 [Rhizomicrobium sp.]|jgi:hypothetical protein
MGRKREVPAAEQLDGLRKARDHYLALADQIHNAAREPSESQEIRWGNEREARRLAAAYDNSFNIQSALIRADYS